MLDATDGAFGRTAFVGVKFAVAHIGRVLVQRYTGIAALLGTPMNQAIFADIQIAGAGAALPMVFAAAGHVVLKLVETGEGTFAQRHYLFEDFLIALREGFQLTAVVVNDADGAGESQFQGAIGDFQGVFGIFHAAAKHRIDIDLKFRPFGEHFQATVESLQTFFGDFVGDGIVDADLQVLQARIVEALNAIFVEEETIGDQTSDHAAFSDMADDVVELGMHQRFAATDRDHRSAHLSQDVQTALHFVQRDRLGGVVELVAIGAIEIAAAHGDDVS